VRETRWPGRLERIVKRGREWILDVAHNPAGAWALRAALSGLPDAQRPRTLVFSCLRDKPLKEMSQILFPLFDQVIFAPIHSARAAAMEDLEAAAVALGTTFVRGATVRAALELAVDRAEAGPVVISGSLYLVGEARPLLVAGEDVEP
jgi:dihydrofolate synthase/folylpolyglutamate synthase